jgi:8-oxo-dGTP diphosphatase
MEIWDIYDSNRNKTGKTHVRGIPLAANDYHLVVEIWIINESGQFIVTKRHPDKPFPNLWECTGGSVVAGENSLEGALREVSEEIGITLNPSNGKIIHQYQSRDTHYDVWLFRQNVDVEDIVLQKEEVTDLSFVNHKELKNLYDENKMIPKHKYIFEILV